MIQSLLWQSGLVLAEYQRRFESDPLLDLPELAELVPRGLADWDGSLALRLTPRGLELSDLLGPWLYSDSVRRRMDSYSLR